MFLIKTDVLITERILFEKGHTSISEHFISSNGKMESRTLEISLNERRPAMVQPAWCQFLYMTGNRKYRFYWNTYQLTVIDKRKRLKKLAGPRKISRTRLHFDRKFHFEQETPCKLQSKVYLIDTSTILLITRAIFHERSTSKTCASDLRKKPLTSSHKMLFSISW